VFCFGFVFFVVGLGFSLAKWALACVLLETDLSKKNS
jgi:hypothetical protein